MPLTCCGEGVLRNNGQFVSELYCVSPVRVETEYCPCRSMVLCHCSLLPAGPRQRRALAGPEPTQGLLTWKSGGGSPVPKSAFQAPPSSAQRPELHSLQSCSVPGYQELGPERGALRPKPVTIRLGTGGRSLRPGWVTVVLS